MSTPRAKSCLQCRVAKARCSLETPCSRCSKRGFDCHYTSRATRERKDGFREIRPSFVKNTQLQDQNGFPVEPPRSSEHADGLITVVDDSYVVPGTVESIEEQIREAQRLYHVEQTSNCDADQAIYYVSSEPHSVEVSNSTSTSNSDDQSQHSQHLFAAVGIGDPLTLDPSQISFQNVSHAPQLMQRGRSLRQGSLTAKMILGRLNDYIREMVDVNQLPPFIHPPCSSQSGHHCASLTTHNCIPPSLYRCIRHMHDICYSRNTSVTWEQISDHLKQLCNECLLYDERTLLQAMQAAVLYGLLCSQASTPLSSRYSGLMVTSIEKLGKRLFSIIPWTLDTIISSREQWILVESIRRMACILYLIDLLLLSDVETPSRGNCETFWDMPLPCHRELWHATTDKEWRELYELTRKNSLTLGRLLLLRQSKRLDEVVAKAGGSAVAEELAEWCERADDLSMLLWMALSIEGEGQSSGSDVGGLS